MFSPWYNLGSQGLSYKLTGFAQQAAALINGCQTITRAHRPSYTTWGHGNPMTTGGGVAAGSHSESIKREDSGHLGVAGCQLPRVTLTGATFVQPPPPRAKEALKKLPHTIEQPVPVKPPTHNSNQMGPSQHSFGWAAEERCAL